MGRAGHIERRAEGALSWGTAIASNLRVKLQLYCGSEIAMGLGKADLFDAIEEAGSISAAARNISTYALLGSQLRRNPEALLHNAKCRNPQQ